MPLEGKKIKIVIEELAYILMQIAYYIHLQPASEAGCSASNQLFILEIELNWKTKYDERIK